MPKVQRRKFINIKCGKLNYVLQFDNFSYYVPFMAKILYGFLKIKRGDVVVDVGAFPGDFTLHASSLVGDSGKVVAIEPHPQNFTLLKANVVLNDLKNVILVNKAISDYEGRGLIAGSSVDAHLSRSEGVEVEVTTLDKLLYDMGLARIDVVKIDVEGQEVVILKGFQRLDEVREIAIETHNASSFHYVTEYLVKKSFHLYILDNFLLVQNTVRNMIRYLPNFVLAELRSRFLALRLLLRYILIGDHPVPACRSHQLRLVYGRKKG